MRPAQDRGGEREQRVVEQHQLAVGGQAAVRLEPVERLRDRAPERLLRGVGPIGAAEAVRNDHRHTANFTVGPRTDVTRSQPGCEQLVSTRAGSRAQALSMPVIRG